MTLKELSQLYYLIREIELDQQRLEGLRAKTHDATQAVSDLSAILSEKRNRCVQERARLEQYIAGIGDSLTRQIFTLRFIDGLSWTQVALRIGGNNTDEGIRKACYRHLKRHRD